MTRKIMFCKLRGRLKELGLSQRDVARELLLSDAAVSMRFNGITQWNLDEIYIVLEMIEATPEQFGEYFPNPIK